MESEGRLGGEDDGDKGDFRTRARGRQPIYKKLSCNETGREFCIKESKNYYYCNKKFMFKKCAIITIRRRERKKEGRNKRRKKTNNNTETVKMKYIRRVTDLIYENMIKWKRKRKIRDIKRMEGTNEHEKEFNKTSSMKKVTKHLESELSSRLSPIKK